MTQKPHNHDGFWNYKNLVIRILEAVEKVDYEYNLTTTLFVITRAYEELRDNFPEGEIRTEYFEGGSEELMINWHNEVLDRDVFLIGRKVPKDSRIQLIANNFTDGYIHYGNLLSKSLLWLQGTEDK